MCIHLDGKVSDPMQPAQTTCAAGTLRRATRSITRVYDSWLARAGLTTTQFSILRSLDTRGEPVTLSELAEELVFERTSLYRALEPLRREALIAFTPGRGRIKRVELTARGKRRVAEAKPYWTSAQEAFLSQFGRSAWKTFATQLVAVVDIARAMPDGDR